MKTMKISDRQIHNLLDEFGVTGGYDAVVVAVLNEFKNSKPALLKKLYRKKQLEMLELKDECEKALVEESESSEYKKDIYDFMKELEECKEKGDTLFNAMLKEFNDSKSDELKRLYIKKQLEVFQLQDEYKKTLEKYVEKKTGITVKGLKTHENFRKIARRFER